MALEGSLVPHEGALISELNSSGGSTSDPRSRLACHSGTDHRDRHASEGDRCCEPFLCVLSEGNEKEILLGKAATREVGRWLIGILQSSNDSPTSGEKSKIDEGYSMVYGESWEGNTRAGN